MENIKHLIDILKSQRALYEEIISHMEKEAECVTKWRVDESLELTKIKDTLIYKERLLEEARIKAVRRIALHADTEKDELTLNEIIEIAEDEEQVRELKTLKDNLGRLTRTLADKNDSLKILYNTNINLVNDFFAKAGFGGKTTYQQNRTVKNQKTSTLSQIG